MIDKTQLDQIGFIVVGVDGYRNCLVVENKRKYEDLISFAREKHYYVYYGKLSNNKVVLPYFLDDASLKHKPKPKEIVEPPKPKEPPKKESIVEVLRCPNCKKKCNSSSGLTLHLKKCKK